MDHAVAPNLYERYRPIRRPVEIGFWIVVLALHAAFDIAIVLMDARGRGDAQPLWQIVVLEASSHLAVLVLVPVVIAFERRFPLLDFSRLGRHLAGHLVGSVLFSLAHVALMVALRQLAFAAAGEAYRFGSGANWLYEYLKDVRTYLLIVGGVLAYRQFMLRWQGEARVLDRPEAPVPQVAPEPPGRPERFLVRKLRREFLIAAGDIDWLQAQGNYVGLRVSGHDYLLRGTLTDFLTQLDPARFARVHRSHAVNLDRIREIEPIDAGDARLHLHDGSIVPCSRRYREALHGPATMRSRTQEEVP